MHDITEQTNQLFALGDQHWMEGNFLEAEQCYLRAIKLFEATYGIFDLNMVLPLKQLSNLYSRMDEPERGIATVNRELHILLTEYGQNDPRLQDSYFALTHYYAALDDYKSVEECLWKWNNCLLPHYESLDESNVTMFFLAQCLLSYVLVINNNIEMANKIIITAVKNAKADLGQNHPWYAVCVSYLGLYYKSQQRNDDSRTCYLRAIEILTPIAQREGNGISLIGIFASSALAAVYNNYATLCTLQKQYLVAEEYLERAFEMRRRMKYPHELNPISKNLIKLFTITDKPDKRQRYEEVSKSLKIHKMDHKLNTLGVIYDDITG